eukprot:CAMPEP_0116009804 /NCGR_PEP_ID=MMETSP0321-20121206/3640_1 /TAXON_ID=163516 /ORGANISM="Leptocylindrus danicus var. danicus, Strain B650" /LENGTH=938 /DNA_ID=CAMNT_0003478815 /DNA_START=538 /DNA_END=3354 /DNA_ORIENTATION=-
MSSYSSSTGECTCENPPKGSETKTPISTRKLVDIYDPITGDPVRKECLECPQGSAVLADGVGLFSDKRSFFSTAGKSYRMDPYICASCPDSNMFFDTDYNCVCRSGYSIVGESAMGEQKCLKDMPSVSSDYTNVKFRSIDIIVESLTFSHHYLKAASDCEYFRTDSNDSFSACQTLANLCVMRLYDDVAAPCIQFQSIIMQMRELNYNFQNDWKYALPWLYYLDEADDITKGREIKMNMSFTEKSGHAHQMKYVLAKYALNGTFMGMEELTNQLFYCPDHGNNEPSSTKWQQFGHSEKIEYTCNVRLLLDMEMFLYDAFIIDESADCDKSNIDGGSCIFPVPVLHRNLVFNNGFPNNNKSRRDEKNDKYTRRFFLFDNMSGRSASGLEVIRYAKSITIKTSIRNDDPKKIYPPQIIIDYNEKKSSDVTATDVSFKVEYTMQTDAFWDALEIILGIVSAFTLVVWMIRVRNWNESSWRGANIGTDGGMNSSIYIIHVAMLACHTFTMIFTPFMLVTCTYWFVFFKLQSTPFIMMPSNNEFYSTDNEYYFYNVTLICLFCIHSVYILYIIIRQCKADVFFIDWEKPKDRKGSVSAWRTIMLVNEWRNCQTMRKTSTEFTLFFMGFLLIGLKLYNAATMQPSMSDLSDNGLMSTPLQFANNAWYWILLSCAQLAWNFLFFERYCGEPKAQQFIDLCTVAKLSLLIMDEQYHGHYLHCRSPHEFADASMPEIIEQLDNERHGPTVECRLDALGAPRDCQAFELFASATFRETLEKIYSSCDKQWPEGRFSSKTSQNTSGIDAAETNAQLNNFLQSFVEQTPKPHREGLRFLIRQKSTIEYIFGGISSGASNNQTGDSPCVLRPDKQAYLKDYGFLSSTLMGIEYDLLIHDVLIFNFSDLLFGNPAINILLTYLVHVGRIQLRKRFGQAHLCRRSLIDNRFLI